jgi:hypothetical protein
MKYLVEMQRQQDEGIWKPLNIIMPGKKTLTISDDISLFDENETSKYYIDWKCSVIIKVTAINVEPDAL